MSEDAWKYARMYMEEAIWCLDGIVLTMPGVQDRVTYGESSHKDLIVHVSRAAANIRATLLALNRQNGGDDSSGGPSEPEPDDPPDIPNSGVGDEPMGSTNLIWWRANGAA